MGFSPWIAVALAVPVLLAGEWLVRLTGWLKRFHIPAPVVGGLAVSLAILTVNLCCGAGVRFQTDVSSPWWTWLVCAEPDWFRTPAKNVNTPFLVAFFSCIGLNASWSLLKRGSVQVLLFLFLSTILAVAQNVAGAELAALLGKPRLLGLICGSVALTGGHGTVMGFAPEFEAAGLSGAAVIGAASATFGVVAGGLLGGPVGGALIRRRNLSPAGIAPCPACPSAPSPAAGILSDIRKLTEPGIGFWRHLLAVLFCVKAGAWISLGVQRLGIVFPVYMGALFLGVVLRNVADRYKKDFFLTGTVEQLSAVTLGIFLTVAMMSLNLIDLSGVAGPMLLILAAQVVLIALFARLVTFRVMGGDYDAAVMSAGLCGFGLGAMPNAIANMKTLTEHYGPAERAFLVVPITGTFLIDLVNAVNITVFLNLQRIG